MANAMHKGFKWLDRYYAPLYATSKKAPSTAMRWLHRSRS